MLTWALGPGGRRGSHASRCATHPSYLPYFMSLSRGRVSMPCPQHLVQLCRVRTKWPLHHAQSSFRLSSDFLPLGKLVTWQNLAAKAPFCLCTTLWQIWDFRGTYPCLYIPASSALTNCFAQLTTRPWLKIFLEEYFQNIYKGLIRIIIKLPVLNNWHSATFPLSVRFPPNDLKN